MATPGRGQGPAQQQAISPAERAAMVAAVEQYLAAGGEELGEIANIQVSFDGGKTLIDLGDHCIGEIRVAYPHERPPRHGPFDLD